MQKDKNADRETLLDCIAVELGEDIVSRIEQGLNKKRTYRACTTLIACIMTARWEDPHCSVLHELDRMRDDMRNLKWLCYHLKGVMHHYCLDDVDMGYVLADVHRRLIDPCTYAMKTAFLVRQNESTKAA